MNSDDQIKELAKSLHSIGRRAAIECGVYHGDLCEWDELSEASKEAFCAIARWHLEQMEKVTQ